MPVCCVCQNYFLLSKCDSPSANICHECVDMGYDELEDVTEPDVDEIKENEDFAHDDDFYNRENDYEDQYLDGSWEDRNEMVNYEGDYFAGDY